MTNGDKIRQMSNEELAEFIRDKVSNCYCCAYDDMNGCATHGCKEGIKSYLDMEVEE